MITFICASIVTWILWQYANSPEKGKPTKKEREWARENGITIEDSNFCIVPTVHGNEELADIVRQVIKPKKQITIFLHEPAEWPEEVSDAFAFVDWPRQKDVYEIYIRKNMPLHMQKDWLLHELKHVEQMLSGRLQAVGSDVIFDGKLYSSEEIENMHYTQIPWERELL
jgi:hypothetical protein